MADFSLSFFSQVLNTQAEVRVILPTPRDGFDSESFAADRGSESFAADGGSESSATGSGSEGIATSEASGSSDSYYGDKAPFPVLYLLHGAHGNQDDWIKNTGIIRYAERFGLCVVMPSGGNSLYLDMPGGLRYFSYVTTELQALVEATFPVSREAKDRYIAGLSMGGYGSLRVALAKPERYAAVISLSGVVEVLAAADTAFKSEMRAKNWLGQALGDDPAFQKKQDLYYLYEEAVKNGSTIPPIYLACGTEDMLYAGNRRFAERMLAEGVDLTWVSDSGAHTWDYWDKHILSALQWLFPEK